MYYVYILECNDGTLYTGYTSNVENRFKQHNKGIGAKYTRWRVPCWLVYVEEFQTKSGAMSREWYIKHKINRDGKLKLIYDYNN